MSTIRVQTDMGHTIRCVVGACDCCLYCGAYIVWGFDRKHKPIALQPWDDSETKTAIHFPYCNYDKPDEREQLSRMLDDYPELLESIERLSEEDQS